MTIRRPAVRWPLGGAVAIMAKGGSEHSFSAVPRGRSVTDPGGVPSSVLFLKLPVEWTRPGAVMNAQQRIGGAFKVSASSSMLCLKVDPTQRKLAS